MLKYGGIPFRETQNYVVKVQSPTDGRTVTASRSVFSRKGPEASGVQSCMKYGTSNRPGPASRLRAHVYFVQFHSGPASRMDNIGTRTLTTTSSSGAGPIPARTW